MCMNTFVCIHVHVHAYNIPAKWLTCDLFPTSGNTEQPNRYSGMLDVDHLLQAVGLHPPAHYQLVSIIKGVVIEGGVM